MKRALLLGFLFPILMFILCSAHVLAQFQEQETNDDFANANFVNLNIESEIIGDLGNGGDHKDYFRLSIPSYCKFKAIYNANPGVGVSMKLYNDTTTKLT